jgi:hypothetical protein
MIMGAALIAGALMFTQGVSTGIIVFGAMLFAIPLFI